MAPDLDGSEDDGVYQEGETTDVAEQPNPDDYPGGTNDPDYISALEAYSAAVRKYWNSERYPVYARVDVKVKFRLPMNWFGAQYWFNITCRNLFDHFNLRGAGGNNAGDLDPYTGKKWSYATGGTTRRYTWGLELKF